MLKYLLIFMLVGCGKINEKIDKMDRKFDQRFSKQSADSDKLVRATHVQVLSTSLEQMRQVDNLSLPVRMFPYAQTFASEASATEIIETCYALLQEVKKSSVLHFKDTTISLNIVASIAGFTSQEKTEEIVKLTKNDFLEKTSYEWLTLRYTVIRDALLKPALESPCPKCFNKAKAYYDKLRYIAESPAVDKLELSVPSLLLKKKVDAAELAALKEQLDKLK